MGCSGSKMSIASNNHNNRNYKIKTTSDKTSDFELERYWHTKATTEISQNEYDNVKKVMNKLGI
jgi:hypothetical protein